MNFCSQSFCKKIFSSEVRSFTYTIKEGAINKNWHFKGGQMEKFEILSCKGEINGFSVKFLLQSHWETSLRDFSNKQNPKSNRKWAT